MPTLSQLSEWTATLDAHLAQLFTSKNEEKMTSSGVSAVRTSGTKVTKSTISEKVTAKGVTTKTHTNAMTVVTTAGVRTTITVKVMTTRITTRLSTVTPTDLAPLSLEKESII